jgi:O-methyltransferase
MDNTFILELQGSKDAMPRTKHRRLVILTLKVVRFFNSHNSYFTIIRNSDETNRFDELIKPGKSMERGNMLQGGMASLEQGINIYHLLCRTIQDNVPGDIVELGCFEGTTAILIQKTLDQFNSDKIIHLYDSFEGLPEKSAEDGDIPVGKGACRTQKGKLIENYNRYQVKLPVIHEGWFSDTLPGELPEKISFAHLDGDFYSSIRESLEYVYPKLSKDAIVVIDDYCDPDIYPTNTLLPGVKRATDEFLRDKTEKLIILMAGPKSHAYFRKE